MERPTPPNKKPRSPRFGLLYGLLAIWLMLFAFDFFNYTRNVEVIPYSRFVTDVTSGRVSDIAVGTERIQGTYKANAGTERKSFVTTRVEDPALTDRLTKAGIRFSGVKENTFWRDLLSWIVPAIVLGAIWVFFMNRMGSQMSRGGGMLPLGKSKARVYMEKDLKTRFDDVAGLDEAKAELQEVVEFLKNPAKFSRLGGRMPKGVLLVGPPGTGKTLMARAVAGEAHVPYFSINGSEFVELFVGLGAARVRDLFEQARAHAPCIIFIDELDALGKARGINTITGASNDEKEQTLNQLLAELDGFDAQAGIVLLGATNRPEVLDPALLRAGRFDRQIVLDKPDRMGREQILKVHMKHVKTAPDVNLEHLASLTAGFSGADLANLVNEGALVATRRGAEQVTTADFIQAIERIVAGLERRSRVLSPEEKRRVAYHEMGHAVVALALGQHEAVQKVSIIPRGVGALGYTLRRPTEDRYLMSRAELEGKLAILVGGRASEDIFFNDISTGAADDLDKATDVAHAMVTRYSMVGGDLGLATYERESAPFLSGGPGSNYSAHSRSEKTAEAIDRAVRTLLDNSFATARGTILHYREVVEEGARELLTKETIEEIELKRIWDAHQDGGPGMRIA